MNDKAVSPVIGVILMVSITIILAAVIAGWIFMSDEQRSDNCNYDEFHSICHDGKECNDVQTKTSVIHIAYEPRILGSNDYVVDADGIAYDWNGIGTSGKFNMYDGHNVTFSYNPCDIVRGRYYIIDVMEDHSCICDCTSCESCKCGSCDSHKHNCR